MPGSLTTTSQFPLSRRSSLDFMEPLTAPCQCTDNERGVQRTSELLREALLLPMSRALQEMPW